MKKIKEIVEESFQLLFPTLKLSDFYMALALFVLTFTLSYNFYYLPAGKLDAIDKLLYVVNKNKLFALLYPPLLFWKWRTSFFLIALAVSAFYLFYRSSKEYPKKLREGKEYGSARWGTSKDIEPFKDMDSPANNVILSKTESLSMNPWQKPWYTQRNKNIMVVGGSGSGKTRYFIKPNLMQMHSSFVVTDPKGTVLAEVGEMLLRGSPREKREVLTKEQKAKGQRLGKEVYEGNSVVYERDAKGRFILEPYKIKVLNLINFLKSMRYNPFRYIKTKKDILTFVNVIIANTNGEGAKSGEDFWVKAERLLYMALVGFILEFLDQEEQHFTSLLKLINAFEVREEDESFKDPVDRIFEDAEKKRPDSFAVLQYKKYKLAAGKTAKSILISCAARLAPFDIPELRELMEEDELDLERLGEEKTALFVIIPDSDSTFNFIAAILYTQMFNLLITRADDVYDGVLPIQVRCLLDEFPNIGLIPQFEKLIATIRSRRISASIVFQTESQCKAIYKDNAETIVGNCDTYVFLGGKENSTLKNLNETLGKETIDTITSGMSYAAQKSSSRNYGRTGRELMTRDELATMPKDKCIVMVSGLYPFYSDKYDITTHPRYKFLGGETGENGKKTPLLDVEAYINQLREKKRIQEGFASWSSKEQATISVELSATELVNMQFN